MAIGFFALLLLVAIGPLFAFWMLSLHARIVLNSGQYLSSIEKRTKGRWITMLAALSLSFVLCYGLTIIYIITHIDEMLDTMIGSIFFI